MSIKVYYDEDGNIDDVLKETIGIIGYGIQGRAQALNLRDSGLNVLIGNKKDVYFEQAKKDKFLPFEIEEIAKKTSIIMLLIPDQAQKEVYETYIKNHLKPNDLLVFAHGYSLRFKEIILPKTIDAVLLAPRMPGKLIRKYYLDGGGVPAFFDIFQNFSGKAKKRGLALAKAAGFTRAGVMCVSVAEETEIDLFMEQFLIPSIIKTMKISFEVLTEKGFSPEVVLMELYASGELGEVLLEASKVGLFEVFKRNASPTCQFGIQQNIDKVLSTNAKETAAKILEKIKNGSFNKLLNQEAQAGHPSLRAYNEINRKSLITQIHQIINDIIRYRPQ